MICGDVGVCGFYASEEAETRKVFRNLPVTTLFIDGNHENFEQLNSYGIDIWNGGKVHFIESGIIHLMRGQVFEIDATRFFTFGGAYSIDKMYRTEGVSWFSEEIPNCKEYEEGWHNLEKVDFQVDYILTHSGPREVVVAMGYGEMSDDGANEKITGEQLLQAAVETIKELQYMVGGMVIFLEAENNDKLIQLLKVM